MPFLVQGLVSRRRKWHYMSFNYFAKIQLFFKKSVTIEKNSDFVAKKTTFCAETAFLINESLRKKLPPPRIVILRGTTCCLGCFNVLLWVFQRVVWGVSTCCVGGFDVLTGLFRHVETAASGRAGFASD